MKDIVDIPKENLEIERKFLLKRFPDSELDKKFPLDSEENLHKLLIYEIEQYYFKVDGKKLRFRLRFCENNGITQYFQTEKHVISSGVFEEIESEIGLQEFLEVFKDNKNKGSVIKKTRYSFEENGLLWEIDKYTNIDIVTLEVELDDINQDIKIPKFLKDMIITELTGKKEFSNHNLSLKNEN